MKKLIGVTIGIIVASLALAVIPGSRDEIHWRWADYKGETSSYESYVKTWPAGRHAGEAKVLYDNHAWADAQAANTVQGFERYVQLHEDGRHVAEARDGIESLHWQEAATANTVQGFERYVQLHEDGRHVAEARDGIESLRWQEAATANTIKAFQNYTTLHPEGPHMREAEAKLASLRTDDAPFKAALKAGTEARLKQFLEDFPGHRKAVDAQQAIRDITQERDIVDLLAEKKVKIQAQGSGIQRVSVRVRRLVPYPLAIRIPVGTYFVSARRSAQNMVTTAESKARLTTGDWLDISVSAACANRPRDIPDSDDSFTVQRSPHQKELAKLMPVLGRAGVGYATRQAAVWIVTDNASYSELGILVSRPQFQPFGGTRTINEEEAARAMQICDEAGIDVTRKRIWNARKQILQRLKDGKLKKWLEQRSRGV